MNCFLAYLKTSQLVRHAGHVHSMIDTDCVTIQVLLDLSMTVNYMTEPERPPTFYIYTKEDYPCQDWETQQDSMFPPMNVMVVVSTLMVFLMI